MSQADTQGEGENIPVEVEVTPAQGAPAEVAATPPPSLAQRLLADAARVYSGAQRFSVVVGQSVYHFEASISPDAAVHLGIRQATAKYVALKGGASGPWGELIPADGISPDIARRIALAAACKLCVVEGEERSRLSERDLLTLAFRAGGLFVLVTDELGARCDGVRSQAEMEALEQAKNA